MTNELFTLIDRIIEDIVDKESNLENALLKTQMLAFKLKNEKLKNWVDQELNGYNDEVSVPTYRTVFTDVKGHLIYVSYAGAQQRPNFQLPIENFDDYEELKKHKFKDKVSQLQELSTSKEGLHGELPHSFLRRISQVVAPWEVYRAWKVIPPGSVTGILSAIKSNLIKFLLELKEELGDDNLPIMEKKKQIDKILEKTVGQIMAENVNISFGDKSALNASSGNNNNIQLSSGSKAKQNISAKNIKELLDYIKENISEIELEESDREELSSEINRTERQLSKPNMSTTIINQSLKVMYDILIGVTGNATTDTILDWIKQIAENI